MINIEDFDSNLLKIDKKSYKNINIYYVGYITMKDSDYVKINSVNSLYLITDKVMDALKKKMEINIQLWYLHADKNKEVLIKYTELWDKIKNLIECNFIEKINSGEYEKVFMKIKFNSDDNLLLNKILKLHNMTIVIRSVFQEDDKHYPQVF